MINFDEFIYQVDLKARMELPPTKIQIDFRKHLKERYPDFYNEEGQIKEEIKRGRY